nr:adhesive plaque matrix protein-like [Penaeus vannamei]
MSVVIHSCSRYVSHGSLCGSSGLAGERSTHPASTAGIKSTVTEAALPYALNSQDVRKGELLRTFYWKMNEILFDIVIVFLLVALAAASPSEPVYGYTHELTYEEPARYDFNYAVKDDYSGNDFGHQEARDDYITQGSYFVLLPDGRLQRVTYTVNGDSGYVVEVSYEGEAQYPEYKPSPVYEPALAYKPSPLYKPAPAYKPEPVYEPAPAYKPASVYEPASAFKPAPVYTPSPDYVPVPSYKSNPVYV